ncbi:hypothetical protein GGS24DRAFT_3683 [Hypoxylon argillaceum]|nr:hypothetical protein GGS24DRAFT_3683 [Hypoxylon argillaceum]
MAMLSNHALIGLLVYVIRPGLRTTCRSYHHDACCVLRACVLGTCHSMLYSPQLWRFVQLICSLLDDGPVRILPGRAPMSPLDGSLANANAETVQSVYDCYRVDGSFS